MTKAGGIVGGLIGFAVSIVFTEIIFPNNAEWPIVVNAGLTAAGALIGVWLTQRFVNREPRQS